MLYMQLCICSYTGKYLLVELWLWKTRLEIKRMQMGFIEKTVSKGTFDYLMYFPLLGKTYLQGPQLYPWNGIKDIEDMLWFAFFMFMVFHLFHLSVAIMPLQKISCRFTLT